MKETKNKKIAAINTALCVACGTCVKICPQKAITIFKGSFASVNTNKCVGCGRCAKACPASIIQLTAVQISDTITEQL